MARAELQLNEILAVAEDVAREVGNEKYADVLRAMRDPVRDPSEYSVIVEATLGGDDDFHDDEAVVFVQQSTSDWYNVLLWRTVHVEREREGFTEAGYSQRRGYRYRPRYRRRSPRR